MGDSRARIRTQAGVTPEPTHFHLQEAWPRGPLVYLAPDLTADLLAPQARQCCSVWPWQGVEQGVVQGRLLTDALETGDRPLGNVRDFVAQALSQAGRTSFTLETRVASIPLPGVLAVTLDPDLGVFNRCGGRARAACKGTEKRGERSRLQLVWKLRPKPPLHPLFPSACQPQSIQRAHLSLSLCPTPTKPLGSPT